MKTACRKYDTPDATYSSYWECHKCIGRKTTPLEEEDPTGEHWEVHDMQKCYLVTSYTKQYVGTMQGHVLRDGGDALCLVFEEDDDKEPRKEKRMAVDTDGKIHVKEEGVGSSRFRKNNLDDLHNHPEHDNIVAHMEKELGITYNRETRELEVAEGHTEESARHLMRKKGLPVKENEADIR